METGLAQELRDNVPSVPIPLILQNLVEYEGATSGTTTGWNGNVDGADDT